MLYDDQNVCKVTKECIEMLLDLYQQGRADAINEEVSDDVCEWKVFDNSVKDDDRWNECSTGIHFFINFQEAVDYK